MANLLLTVYDLACSSILQCFLVDEEISISKGNNAGKHRPAALESFFDHIQKAPPAQSK